MELGDDSSLKLTHPQRRVLRSIKETIKIIVNDKYDSNEFLVNHHLNGTFRQLCTKNGVQEVLFPGASIESLRQLPNSLKEILLWNNITLDLTKISKQTVKIIENMKRKGLEKGDYMDEQTENILLPQIAQEALAKEIVEAVRSFNRKVSKMAANVLLTYAAPSNEAAEPDQLDDWVVQQLNTNDHLGIQYNYLGEDWAELVVSDISRYFENEKFSILDKDGNLSTTILDSAIHKEHQNYIQMCWLEKTEVLKENYAALFEGLRLLHNLPYEINKNQLPHELKLLQPNKGCSMLLRFPVGSRQISRFDSRDDGGDLDSGIRVTAAYHLLSKTPVLKEICEKENAVKGANELHLFDESRQKTTQVEIQHDLLTLHKSAKIRNSRMTTCSEYYVLLFFMHGKSAMEM